MTDYKIVRVYHRPQGRLGYFRRTIASRLTLAQAKAWLALPDASWKTATNPELKRTTKRCGPWQDIMTEM